MHSAYEAFKEAGFIAWIILLIGLTGGVASVVTLLLLALRSRVAPWVALATMVLGAMAAGLGGAGVMYGRSVVDRAIGGGAVNPTQYERIQRQGYLEARSAAKVGLFFAHLPLAVGLTMFLRRRRRPEDAPLREPSAGVIGAGVGVGAGPGTGSDGPGLGAPIGVTALALLTYGFAFVALRAPLPGRDIAVDDPVWRVLDEIEQVQQVEGKPGGEALQIACKRLEDALPTDPSSPNPTLMPGFPAAARKCLDDRRANAAVLSPLARVRSEMEAIAKSPLALRDPESRRQIEADLAEIKSAPGAEESPAEAPRRKGAQVRMGATQVSGRLPPEVIQRIVRQNFGRFRLCYENGLRTKPTLQGRVTVRFLIGRDGAVTSVSDGGTDLPDKEVVACVMRAFSGLSFPQPEGGIVTVSYPIMFSPPE